MEKERYQTKEKIYEILQRLSVEYNAYDHEASPTMEHVLKNVKLENSPFIKNLLYINSKKKEYYLVSARHDVKVEKGFWRQLGLGAGNMRLATPEQVKEVLNVEVGSVSPFCLINDHEKKVKAFVLDKNLETEQYLSFHPLVNNAIIELQNIEFQKFLNDIGIEPKYIDLSQVDVVVVQEEKGQKNKDEETKQGNSNKNKEEEEGLTKLRIEYKKSENFSKWYSQVIIKSELIDYYDVSGCYILRPAAYNIWETIQRNFDQWIKELGVENAYFPMFVSQKALETEKEHVEGFAPEVAWVTKSGQSDLKEPIAIRPTSETIMYPAYSKWVSSHRDLPILLNQWTNVVRWEFKHPTPFIRTREFLWQEGHTAHTTLKESEDMVYTILDLYEKVYRDVLAVPVIKGKKTNTEKFAGGYYTTTIETIIPANSRGVQAATSHNLGQNFSKMFNISFENEKKEKEYAWQTSWGLTTRSIGVMIMYHGDDKGLVLPPKVARYQVVIVPIIFKDKTQELIQYANNIYTDLKKAGVRVYLDDSSLHSPGWKFNNWELKGVPIRFEVGPKEVEKNLIKIAKRYNGAKDNINRDNLVQWTQQTLQEIQEAMYHNASQQLNQKIRSAGTWETFMQELNSGHGVITPWCGDDAEEEKVKQRSAVESKNTNEDAELQLTGAAKTLCIPFEQQPIQEGETCFFTGRPALYRVLWGRSY